METPARGIEAGGSVCCRLGLRMRLCADSADDPGEEMRRRPSRRVTCPSPPHPPPPPPPHLSSGGPPSAFFGTGSGDSLQEQLTFLNDGGAGGGHQLPLFDSSECRSPAAGDGGFFPYGAGCGQRRPWAPPKCVSERALPRRRRPRQGPRQVQACLSRHLPCAPSNSRLCITMTNYSAVTLQEAAAARLCITMTNYSAVTLQEAAAAR